jgi:hypothetical protein
LHTLGAAPVAAVVAFAWTADDAALAADAARRAMRDAADQQQPYVPRFLTAEEYATVIALGDMIIPRDERSGAASAAGAPQFIDHIAGQQPERQTALRGGLVWLDTECRRRFDKAFVACPESERRQVLDDIAYPARARPEVSHGVQFFTMMRDLVATGFWSSRIGVDDLGYMGNRPAIWTGAPENVMQKLGLRYED